MQFVLDIALSLVYFCAFLLLCAWSWRFWKMYINQKYLNDVNQKFILLEIKLPREIFKSPYATDVAISALLQGGGVGTWYDRNFKGKLPIYSSLEIASLEGVIHFYIRIEGRFRSLVESNFYAQYPGIEIVEADDYTKKIRYHHLTKDVSAWGARYKLGRSWKPTNPKTGEPYPDPKNKKDKYSMPADFIPIKTYVDYGLDKDPKEEFKIEPLTPMLEFMGSIGEGEYFWYQILISDEKVYDNKKMPKLYVNDITHEHISLSEMADMYKKQIKTSGYVIEGKPVLDDNGDPKKKQTGKDAEGNPIYADVLVKETKPISKKEVELSPEEKDEIEAVNKKLSKPLAHVVIRLLYVTKKDRFQIGNVMNIVSFGKPFSGANSLAPTKVTQPYQYPWQNWRGRREPWRTEEMFDAYVEREGFFPHIGERASLDKMEDSLFWDFSMKTRKTWRLLYEGIFHPFSHPKLDDVITLNTEEIATLWHLPGAVATTPTLPRIDSAKGVAPVNLPH